MNQFQVNARKRRRGSVLRKAHVAVRDHCYARLGESQAEAILASSRDYQEPHPIIGLPAYVMNREFHPVIQGGSPGFTSYNDIINALTVNARGQRLFWRKNSVTTVAANWYSMWGNGGFPAAGAFGTALTGRTRDRTATGTVNYTDATGGRTMYALKVGLGSTVAWGTAILYDRLAEYPFDGSVTGAQNFNAGAGIAPPSRDVNGAALGAGVLLVVENDVAGAATSATPQTDTYTYTNSASTGGQSTGAQTMNVSVPTSGLIYPSTGPWWPLASGDNGVQKITAHSLSATITSTKVTAVLARPLATIPMLNASSYTERDLVLQTPALPTLYSGTCFAWILLANTATSPFFTEIQIAEN